MNFQNHGIDADKLLNGASLFLIMFLVSLLLDWRKLVKIALVLLVFEGAVRKWVLPGLSQFVYFGKDFLLVIAYAKYFTSKEVRQEPVYSDRLLSLLILTSSLFVCIQASNVALGSPLIGIIGVRNYLVFMPLIFVMKHLFRTQEELAYFLKWYLVLCIPVVMLSVSQYFAPPDSFLNIYVSEEDTAKALVGSNVRATGTFSYISGFSCYLQVVAALVIPMLILRIGDFWHRIIQVVLVSVIVGILFSGSRTPVISVGLFVVGYLLCNKVFRTMGLYKKLLLPLFVLGMILIHVLADSLENMIVRFSDRNLGMRILASVTTPFDYIPESGFFGFGSGATYQANAKIREIFDLPPGDRIPVFFEAEPEKIMLEQGPLGFVLWYGLRLRLIVCLWQVYSILTLPLLRELALSGFLLHSISFLGQMVFQVTFSFYYWFFAGFIALLPILERNELMARAEEDEEYGLDSNITPSSFDHTGEITEDDWNWNRDRSY